MSTNPHARFFGLLKQLPHQSKEDLVWQYSNMLTTSLSEFASKRPEAYTTMIRDLERTVNKMEEPKQPQKPSVKTTSAITKKLRSGILTRLQKHGVDTTSWAKVNSFMENPRIAGQKLYEMTDQEMIDFIPKLVCILKKDKQRQEETERLTLMN
ncbi:MAG: hypothetical protein A2066_18750 [Bacteroidetes bacterium GWB2_41_8]|nr:MAG: hypothetical protein A2066_18750 [Bacteroidetes bacterium GWB2_41_8]